MKLNLPKTIDGGSRMRPLTGIKKCTNHSKNPRLSKDGKRVIRGYGWKQIRKINELHAKSMLANKELRIKLGNF